MALSFIGCQAGCDCSGTVCRNCGTNVHCQTWTACFMCCLMPTCITCGTGAIPWHSRQCTTCYVARFAVTAPKPKCSRCHKKPANPGYKWCQGCFDESRGAYVVTPIMCSRCHNKPAVNPAKGHMHCQGCFDHRKVCRGCAHPSH